MQFFLTVGVITTIIFYALGSYFVACIAYGCYDKMREAHADYHYDLNWKSRASSVLYACGGLSAAWIVVGGGTILLRAIAEVM